jgi:hypothetical protein
VKSAVALATADNINEAHRLARSCAETAIKHAIRCGQLLLEKQKEVDSLQSWIEEHGSFGYSTAKLYMRAARQNAAGVAFDSLRGLFPSGRPPAQKANALAADTPPAAAADTFPSNETLSAPKSGESESGLARPDSRHSQHPPRVSVDDSRKDGHPEPSGKAPPYEGKRQSPAQRLGDSAPGRSDDTDPEAPERPQDIDEDAALAAAEADLTRRMDAVMSADDKLVAAHAQLKQQAALIGTLETTRDGYMRGKEAVTKLLQAEKRKTAKLEKENARLRERLAVMEAA